MNKKKEERIRLTTVALCNLASTFHVLIHFAPALNVAASEGALDVCLHEKLTASPS